MCLCVTALPNPTLLQVLVRDSVTWKRGCVLLQQPVHENRERKRPFSKRLKMSRKYRCLITYGDLRVNLKDRMFCWSLCARLKLYIFLSPKVCFFQASLTILLNITIITLLPGFTTFFNLLGTDLRIIDPMNHTDWGAGCCWNTWAGTRMLAPHQDNLAECSLHGECFSTCKKQQRWGYHLLAISVEAYMYELKGI